jgi:hypothetical protein
MEENICIPKLASNNITIEYAFQHYLLNLVVVVPVESDYFDLVVMVVDMDLSCYCRN